MNTRIAKCANCGVERELYTETLCFPCFAIERHKQIKGASWVPGTKFARCKICKKILVTGFLNDRDPEHHVPILPHDDRCIDRGNKVYIPPLPICTACYYTSKEDTISNLPQKD